MLSFWRICFGRVSPPKQAMVGRSLMGKLGSATEYILKAPPPLGPLLTISGAAILGSRINFLFHHKNKQEGKQLAKGSPVGNYFYQVTQPCRLRH